MRFALPFPEFLLEKMVTQNPKTRSTIKNQMVTAHIEMNARGVSSITTFQMIGKAVNKCFA